MAQLHVHASTQTGPGYIAIQGLIAKMLLYSETFLLDAGFLVDSGDASGAVPVRRPTFSVGVAICISAAREPGFFAIFKPMTLCATSANSSMSFGWGRKPSQYLQLASIRVMCHGYLLRLRSGLVLGGVRNKLVH